MKGNIFAITDKIKPTEKGSSEVNPAKGQLYSCTPSKREVNGKIF